MHRAREWHSTKDFNNIRSKANLLASCWLVTLLGGVVDDGGAQIVERIREPMQLEL